MNTVGKQRIIVLDGHDGAGKSTLAVLLAKRLGGRYVKPFDGKLGDMIAWLWKGKRFEFGDRLARAAVEKILGENSEAPLLVFDRHWLTMFTVLPEKSHNNWFPLPATILCWTDVDTTQRRLEERGEPAGERSKHEHYCSLYRTLARRYEVPVIDTTHVTIEEALDSILSELKRLWS